MITALGMLKRNVLEVKQLEESFTRLRAAARASMKSRWKAAHE